MSDELIMVDLNDEEVGHQGKWTLTEMQVFIVHFRCFYIRSWMKSVYTIAETRRRKVSFGRSVDECLLFPSKIYGDTYRSGTTPHAGRAGNKYWKSGRYFLLSIFTDFLKPVQSMSMTTYLSESGMRK